MSVIAKDIIAVVLDDLSDRRGLSDEWDQIDDDIQAEIKKTWERLIDGELRQAGLVE